MFDPSQPPLVSETLLKKRRSLDELAHRRSVTVQRENKVIVRRFHMRASLADVFFAEKKSCSGRKH
jgi:hypothetical protein